MEITNLSTMMSVGKISPALHAKVKKFAKKNNTTITAITARALREYVGK
jgi:predicted transcriptional regulator